MNEFVYRVDGNDRITFVDANWLAFGEANGFAGARSVIGTSLWRHMGDMTSRYFFDLFLKKVRWGGKAVTVPFRCDGPTRRRFMEMRILRRDEEVEFRSRLVREEVREPVALLSADAPRDERLLMMCVWCKRVDVSDWVEAEKAVHYLKLFEGPSLPMISHVTCPHCEKAGLRSVIS